MTTRFAVLAMMTAACAGNPAPVPVDIAPADRPQLEGRWRGSYDSERTGSHGSIVFTLEASADTARGDVLMVPAVDQREVNRNRAIDSRLPTAPDPPSILTIRLVRVRGNEVAGTLDPYLSPDCDCVVVTVFAGRVDGNVIRGTYVTEGQFARVAEGVWHVVRENQRTSSKE